jgi:uncharacterized membrane protein
MRELTVGLNLTAGSANTIYTVPKGCKAIATLLFIANGGGTTKSVTAGWHDVSAGDTITIAGSSSLNAGTYLQFSDGRMVMDEGDYVTVTPEASSTMSCILTVEIHQNTSYQNGS